MILNAKRGFLRRKRTQEGGRRNAVHQFILHESFVSLSVVCKDAVLTVPERWDLNA